MSSHVTLPTEAASNGKIVTSTLELFEVSSPYENLPAFEPENGAAVTDEIIQVNGILTDLLKHIRDLQGLANTGARVWGIHNSSYGLMGDILEYSREKLHPVARPGFSPSTDSLCHLMYQAVEQQQERHFLGHSHGGLKLSRALGYVQQRLVQEGSSQFDAEEKMGVLKVETHGTGGAGFVDGPQYVHYYNRYDPVPQIVGVGMLRRRVDPTLRLGRGAVVYRFKEINRSGVTEFLTSLKCLPMLIDNRFHGPCEIYWPYRVPFDQARQGNFGCE